RSSVEMHSDLVHSISAHAQCDGPTGRYETWIDSAREQRIRLRQASDRCVFHAVANGDVCWTIDEETGARELGAAPLVHAVRNHDFHMLVLEPWRVTRSRFDDADRLVGFATTDSRDEKTTIETEYLEWREVETLLFPSLVVVNAVEGAFQ